METRDYKQEYDVYEKLDELSREQKKLSKLVKLKDNIDIDAIDKVGGISVISKGDRIVCGVVVMQDNEILEQKYSYDKARFPYIPGFRAYRELPVMMKVFELVEEKPDLFFINASGVCHPRKFGLATHFSIATGIPVIGMTEKLLYGNEKNGNVYIGKELVAEKVITKEGAKPIYVCPGNFISVRSAVKITKRFVKKPHKFPEPLRKAKKYVKKIAREILK